MCIRDRLHFVASKVGLFKHKIEFYLNYQKKVLHILGLQDRGAPRIQIICKNTKFVAYFVAHERVA